MGNGRIACRVLDMIWLTPSVMELRFEPEKSFKYEPGQFVSLVIPDDEGPSAYKRMYSFASPHEHTAKEGYRLCVKFNPGGKGSTYIASLKPGDSIEILAPYGDFIFEGCSPSRQICFISTGTGIAPLRAMALSSQLRDASPKHVIFLYGCRDEREILYPELNQDRNIEVVHAVSKPRADWLGFKGRVTDFLTSRPKDFPWHGTDFYLCGSPQMAMDVTLLLTHTFGVSLDDVHQEVFAAPTANPEKIKEEIRRVAA
jgi:Na+-transporting NADH:ubiquinone oxidoreductase subunit F